MGVAYLTADELADKKDYIAMKLTKGGWLCRDTYIQSVIKEHIHDRPHDAVVDVGCGSGALMMWLRENKVDEVIGVDIDTYGKNEWVRERTRLVDANSQAWPIENGKVGAVIASAFLEHVENPYKFFREAARVLPKGGTLIFTLPNIASLRGKLGFLFTNNLVSYRKNNNHIAVLTSNLIEKAMSDDFRHEGTYFSPGSLSAIRGLRKFNNKLPRTQWFANDVCYVYKKI